MDTYTVQQHADGYEVREQNASHGISTHANILDALNTCRVANTWSQRAARAERINYAATSSFLKVQAT
jgi:hypothetical protein